MYLLMNIGGGDVLWGSLVKVYLYAMTLNKHTITGYHCLFTFGRMYVTLLGTSGTSIILYNIFLC